MIQGKVFGSNVGILIDSGATDSFISTHILDKLSEKPRILKERVEGRVRVRTNSYNS